MKFLCTVGFLVLLVFQGVVSNKVQQSKLDELKGKRRSQFATFVTWFVPFVTTFGQFWLLTRLFPTTLIGVLIGGWIAAMAINSVIGAIAGFGLQQNQEKIQVLAFIWGVQNRVVGCLSIVGSGLAMAVTMFGSLWVFWSHPIGDAHAKAWIAILLFVVPQLVALPLSIAMSWPIIASEFMDDDLRNSSLANSFSAIISQTLWLFFPVYFVRTEIQEVFKQALPHLWIFIAIPIIFFLLGSLLPFFLGVHRYRLQSRSMLHWQETWLNGLDDLLQLPSSPIRDTALRQKQEQLNREIERMFTQNPIFEFYTSLVEKPLEGAEAAVASVTGDPHTMASPAGQLEPSRAHGQAETKANVESAHTLLSTRARSPLEVEIEKQVGPIVRKHQSDLVDWDIRFGYVAQLLELYDISLGAATQNLSDFVKRRLEHIKAAADKLTTRKNVLVGSLETALSGIFLWLLKNYHRELFDFIRGLVT
jgi:hypothetical protein